jgi:hypothetical protein
MKRIAPGNRSAIFVYCKVDYYTHECPYDPGGQCVHISLLLSQIPQTASEQKIVFTDIELSFELQNLPIFSRKMNERILLAINQKKRTYNSYRNGKTVLLLSLLRGKGHVALVYMHKMSVTDRSLRNCA